MKLLILFLLSICVYLFHRYLEARSRRLTDDVLNSMKLISASLKDGESIESALKSFSEGSDRAAGLYQEVIGKMDQGMTLSEAFESVSNRYDSHVVRYLSKLMLVAEHSNEDIADELNEFSTLMNKYREIDKRLHTTTAEHLTVLQVIVIIIMPLAALFLPRLLDVPVHQPIYYFMGFTVVLFASLDYLVYADLKKTLFVMPVFLTGYLLVISKVAPYVANLFLNIW